MLIKYYVAHEVVLKKVFVKYGVNYDLTSCHFNNYYLISRKAILLIRDKNGNYLYSNNKQKCTVIDPNDLVSSVTSLACNNCIMKKTDQMHCEEMGDIPVELVGVIGIRPIASFDRNGTWTEGIRLVVNYNNKVQKEVLDGIQDEYQCVNDIEYPDFIRGIDDSIKQIVYDNSDVKKRVMSL